MTLRGDRRARGIGEHALDDPLAVAPVLPREAHAQFAHAHAQQASGVGGLARSSTSRPNA